MKGRNREEILQETIKYRWITGPLSLSSSSSISFLFLFQLNLFSRASGQTTYPWSETFSYDQLFDDIVIENNVYLQLNMSIADKNLYPKISVHWSKSLKSILSKASSSPGVHFRQISKNISIQILNLLKPLVWKIHQCIYRSLPSKSLSYLSNSLNQRTAD